MAKEPAKEAKKTKRPTAIKRDMQSKKRNLKNRNYKAKVRTAIRSYNEGLQKGDESKEKLQDIYSLMDKGVKKGIFKANKASRVKSRMAVRKAK